MSTTQHPLTDEARDRLAAYITHGTIDCSSEEGRYDSLTEDDARRIIDSLWGPMTEAAFDAGREHERTTPTDPDHDPRPWEPLNGPVRVGDEVRQDDGGVTAIAVVGRIDEEGDPWTAEGRFIGVLEDGTWYARRAAQALPTTTEKEAPIPAPWAAIKETAMSDATDHPLTETDAAGIYGKDEEGHTLYAWRNPERSWVVRAMGAAFDAGREHERTAPADPRHDPRPWQDCTREDIRKGDLVEALNVDRLIVGVAYRQDEFSDWLTENGLVLTHGPHLPLRRVPAHTTEKETPMPETTPAPAEPLARTLLGVPEGYGAPHHDADQIKPEDFVLQVDEDGFVRAGIAHRHVGDWRSKGGLIVANAAWRADRPDAITVWPAPTPPAEEVEMPGEPRRLTDVVLSGGEAIAEAAWTGAVLLYARHPLATSLVVAPADQIEQWTLDGTRARRDGERANGEPRFVKTQEGEK